MDAGDLTRCPLSAAALSAGRPLSLPGVCRLLFADRYKYDYIIQDQKVDEVRGKEKGPLAHSTGCPYHFVCPIADSSSSSVFFSVKSDFPVDGSFLDRLAAQVHRSSHDSSLPRLRGFKNRISLQRHYGILLDCLGGHNLGISYQPSAGSHPRGQGKGRRLGERKCSLSDSVRSRYALTPFSHILFSHDASFRVALGSSSYPPLPNVSKQGGQQGLVRQGFERLVSSIQHYRFPSSRSRYHTHRYYLLKHLHYHS